MKEFFSMSKLRSFSAILGLFLAGIISSSAFAGTALTLDAVGTYGKLSNNATGATDNYAFGFPGGAALLEFRGASPLGLELGGWYLSRNTQETIGAQTTYDQYWAQGTANLTLHMNRHLMLSGGGYYAAQTSGDNFHGIGTSPKDYGVMGGVDLLLPFAAGTALDLGARYQYGLANIANNSGYSANSVKLEAFSFVVGLRFGGTGMSR